MRFLIPAVLLWVLASVCDGQVLETATANTTGTHEVCRRCSADCVQVTRLDGGCPGCICNGFLLPDCPNVDCPNENEPSCVRQRTPDGCAECVCVEEILQPEIKNDALPETINNNADNIPNVGAVCPSLPPCPQHCQQIDQTGCPVCDCSSENEVFGGNLPDAVQLCPPLPLCPVGCIEMQYRGEFDCFECNCTLPELGLAADQALGGFNPFGNFPSNRPRINPNDPSGGLLLFGGPSAISPFDAGPVCGETECREGCRLCIGRDGCGRCLCGSESVICPAFPLCPASCISQASDGCLACTCAPESLGPELQSVIIDRIPPSLQPEFVSDLAPDLSGLPPQTLISNGFGFDMRVPSRRPQRIPLRVISGIISQFTPDFIFNLPYSVRIELATQLLSIIRPQHRANLSPEFVMQTSPNTLFRTPVPPPGPSSFPSDGRRPSFGSPLGNQFPNPNINNNFPFPPRNPSLTPQNRPEIHTGLIPQDNLAGASFGFSSSSSRNPDSLNYVPSSVIRPQEERHSPSNNGFMNGRRPPHSQREFSSNPAINTLQQQNPLSRENVNNDLPIGTENVARDGSTRQSSNPRSPVQGLQNQDPLPNQGNQFTGGVNSPLRVQFHNLGRVFEGILVVI